MPPLQAFQISLTCLICTKQQAVSVEYVPTPRLSGQIVLTLTVAEKHDCPGKATPDDLP